MKTNVYSGGALDRAATSRCDPAWVAARLADPSSFLVPVWKSQSLIHRDGDEIRAALLPVAGAPWVSSLPEGAYLLGTVEGRTYFAADLSAQADPAKLLGLSESDAFVDLRSVGAILPRREASLLAFARGLAHWHQGHGFCGRCGAPTRVCDGGYVRRCTSAKCGIEHYPRTDPAVIVLVSCNDKCLLARQSRWTPGMVSTLAGFVEPGESLEEAVLREVMEETGVKVERLRYHSSQPWPFPSSLMVGFMAETDRQAPLVVDHHELETAGWFSRKDIADFASQGRSLPRADSIARQLIETWLAEQPL